MKPATAEEQKLDARRKESVRFLNDYLGVLQRQFYTGPGENRRFFAQRFMLVRAITWPAAVMKSLGVWLPPERMRALLNEIIKGIKQKGDTAKIKHFGAYFLHSVQTHVKLRQDHLYEEGKTASARGVNAMPLADILKGVAVADDETPAQTTDALVEIAATFKPGRRKKKEKPTPPPPDPQGNLF